MPQTQLPQTQVQRGVLKGEQGRHSQSSSCKADDLLSLPFWLDHKLNRGSANKMNGNGVTIHPEYSTFHLYAARHWDLRTVARFMAQYRCTRKVSQSGRISLYSPNYSVGRGHGFNGYPIRSMP